MPFNGSHPKNFKQPGNKSINPAHEIILLRWVMLQIQQTKISKQKLFVNTLVKVEKRRNI